MIKYLLIGTALVGGGLVAWKTGLFSKKKPVVNNRGRVDLKKLPKPKDVIKQTRQSGSAASAAQLMIPLVPEAPPELTRPKIVPTNNAPTRQSGAFTNIPRTRVAPKPAASALMSQRSFNKYQAQYGN